ncbi:MAG: hypothetical protein QW196_08085 [Sulfolobales archaeon]
MIKVKVQARVTKTRSGKEYKTFYVTVPSSIAEFLSLKEGDTLWCDIKTVNVNGGETKAIVYYKVER